MSRIDASTLVFFDASCLIAAAISPNGGAGFIWGLCERGFLQAAVSQSVLTEVVRNLERKADPIFLEFHKEQLRKCAPRVAPIPLLDEQPPRFPEINKKSEPPRSLTRPYLPPTRKTARKAPPIVPVPAASFQRVRYSLHDLTTTATEFAGTNFVAEPVTAAGVM